MLMVTVGKTGRSISKQDLVNNPKSTEIIAALIDYTIESVYKKTSQHIGATRMVVDQKLFVPAEVALRFYISTVHFVKKGEKELPIYLVGSHYIPFDKTYMISFIIVTPPYPEATDEYKMVERVLNSFHMIGQTLVNQ